MDFTQKSSKKRPAPAQGGPKAKKLHVENRSSKVDSKKRSKPITQPLDAQDPDSESGEDLEDDIEAEVDEKDESAMQVDPGWTNEYKTPKDPNGSSTSIDSKKSCLYSQ